jgi:UPF0716 protein FxsA
MMPLLGALFLAIPLIEIALFVVIGGRIGLLATVFVVLATGIAGAAVISYQGIGVIETLQKDLAEGRLPVVPVIEGFLLLAAALLLITPGFATDAIGFALALPPVRRAIARKLRDSALAKGVFAGDNNGPRPRWHGGPHASEGQGPIIEGEIVDSDRRGTARKP